MHFLFNVSVANSFQKFRPDELKNSVADEKIRQHAILYLHKEVFILIIEKRIFTQSYLCEKLAPKTFGLSFNKYMQIISGSMNIREYFWLPFLNTKYFFMKEFCTKTTFKACADPFTLFWFPSMVSLYSSRHSCY
jgi:hypothetical protein